MNLHTKTGDSYEDFAPRYDLFSENFTDFEEAPSAFFSHLFNENNVKTVLDCACGTGRHLYLLKSMGYDVSGSDISDAMLEQAAKNLASCGLYVPLKKADYRELPRHYNQPFDAVLCLSTAIGEMPDEAGVLKAFQSIRSVLRDNSILILTQGTTDRQYREKPRFMLVRNTQEFTLLFVIDYTTPRTRYNILDMFHGEKESGLKVWSIDLFILLKEAQGKLLKEAGFGHVDFYGDYFLTPYDTETSRQLITVARK